MESYHTKIKTKEQIDGIRKSCQLAAKSLDLIEDILEPGQTTKYFNDIINKFIEANNGVSATMNYTMGNSPPYPRETCISLNEVVCHGIPSDDVVVKEGDIFNIDVATILDGYYGDTSRMFTVGEVSEEAFRLIECTKNALDIGIAQVWPGNSTEEIGIAIYNYVKLVGS